MTTVSRRWGAVVVALMVSVTGIAACGDDDDDAAVDDTTSTTVDGTGDDDAVEGDPVSIPIVTITASQVAGDDGTTAYSFEIEDGLTAGPTQINLKNDGTEPHHAQIFSLNDDATMDQFGEALAAGDIGAMLQLGAFVGGTGTADPGSESVADALVELAEGEYVLLCFVEDANGAPHLAFGMVEPFSVGAADGAVAEMPTPDATVNMVDFGFDTTELPSNGVLEIVNASDSQLHEMNMLKFQDGAGVDDATAFFSGPPTGPPPFAGVGGMQAVMPQGSSFLVLEDLEPGDYGLICLIPDPADGVPHAQKGMLTPATVA